MVGGWGRRKICAPVDVDNNEEDALCCGCFVVGIEVISAVGGLIEAPA